MPSLFSSDWDMLSRTASSCCHLLGQLPANFGQLASPLTGSQCNDTLFIFFLLYLWLFLFFFFFSPALGFPDVLTGQSWKLPAFPAARVFYRNTPAHGPILSLFPLPDTYAYKHKLSNRSMETGAIYTPTLKLINKAWYSVVYGYFCLCPTEC